MGAPGKMLVDAAIIVSQVGKQSDFITQDDSDLLTQDSHVHISSSYQRICTAYILVYQSKKLATFSLSLCSMCSLQISVYCNAIDTVVVSD